MGFFKNLFKRKEKNEEDNKEEILKEKLSEESTSNTEREKNDEPISSATTSDIKQENIEAEIIKTESIKEEISEKEVNKIKESSNEVIQETKEISSDIIEENIEKIVDITQSELIENNAKVEDEEIKSYGINTEIILKEEDSGKNNAVEENFNTTQENESSEKKGGFFSSLKEKLFKSRTGFFGSLKKLITGRNIVDDEMYDELEEILIQSDIGYEMTTKIVSELSKEVKKLGINDPKETYDVLKKLMEGFLIKEGTTINIESGRLNVILVVGVNGVGKTTTIGKLASKYTKEGKKVILGAADTFRAAAIEQLVEWGKRAGVEVVSTKQGGDPGAVVYDSLDLATKENADILIIDTAGRLHNKNNLMKELEKINNIIKKKINDNPYETILVIDGTTGQNAISQAKEFNEVTDLTGFIITKLDGTAKGGIVFSVSELIKKPIKFIGIGEKIGDLKEFDVKEYIEAIFD
ncbi:fused signal recognition particle receptor [Fusobacterium sp. PH5-44]